MSTTTIGATVKCPAGTISGRVTKDLIEYRGIPYAKPPIGPLRWQAPQALAPLSDYQATEFQSQCAQPASMFATENTVVGSEDCLYLNVYVPNTTYKAPLPVMVWIHGGGFITGSSDQFDPSQITVRQQVITVSFNYRLGPLGFLSHPSFGEDSGNFGSLDQQMALQWVQHNIAAFGGDPDNITLFGESAGGAATGFQLVMPSSKGLFGRAIIQSGPVTNDSFIVSRAQADQQGQRYVARLGGCQDDVTGSLANASLEDIVLTSGVEEKAAATEWGPIYGTSWVPLKPIEAFRQGQFNRVSVINGSNHNEGTLFAYYASLGGQFKCYGEVKHNIALQTGSSWSQELEDAYPDVAFDTPAAQYAKIMTDFMFACPAYQVTQVLAQYVDVYAYEFCDAAPINVEPNDVITEFGAYHAADITYVFQTPFDLASPSQFSGPQKALSDAMQAYWGAFAKHGVPKVKGETQWPTFKPSQPTILKLDSNDIGYVETFEQTHQYEIWRKYLT